VVCVEAWGWGGAAFWRNMGGGTQKKERGKRTKNPVKIPSLGPTRYRGKGQLKYAKKIKPLIRACNRKLATNNGGGANQKEKTPTVGKVDESKIVEKNLSIENS